MPQEPGGLKTFPIVGFVTTTDPAKARQFYGDILGLDFVSQDNFAVVFKTQGNTIRVGIAQKMTPAGHTVLGWEVPDVSAMAKRLTAAGVKFERFPSMPQDDLGIWDAPGGSRVAWFKDPDGNVLSISQH